MKKMWSGVWGKKLVTSRWFVYVLSVLALYLALGQLAHSVRVWYINDGMVQLCRLTDALLLSFLILCWRRKWLVVGYQTIVALFLCSVIGYFRTYGTIMPPSSYLLVNNLDGLLPSIQQAFRPSDILIVLPIVGFLLYYVLKGESLLNSKPMRLSWLLPVLLSIGFLAYVPYIHKTKYETPLYWYSIEQSRSFKQFGFIQFWIYQMRFMQGVSEQEVAMAEQMMAEINAHESLATCDTVSTSRNLILILVESMQSWPIQQVVHGVEITPHINSLLAAAGTQYFAKEIPQVKDGRSSDAQLIINTGLLPLLTGATSGLCTTNTFPSLPFALKEKGYHSASLICDSKEYWNQETMSKAYGFDALYDYLQGDEGREKADEHLFARALPILQQLPQPFYAQVVTLSGHAPYLKPLMNSRLMDFHFEDEAVRNYLIAMQYMDQCIGRFVEELKRTGLYDSSVVVITGDHEEMTMNRYEGRQELEAEDCFVPFIVLNSPLVSSHTDKVIAQMDIYPSLLSLMGCGTYFFKGLGENLFGKEVSDCASYRTGIWAAGQHVPDAVQKSRADRWPLSDILLRMDYFGKQVSENL